MGSSLFWYENWTGLGELYFLVPQDFGIDENIHNVHDVTLDGEWDVDRLFEILPEDLAVHILEKIKPPSTMQVLDRPFWMLETRGYFSVKSAWEYTRRRDEPRIAYRKIWIMDGIWKPPWIISEEVEEMMQLMNGGNYTVTHIHREANKLVDHLANYALDAQGRRCHYDAYGTP
uniref:Uncharacterized protein LOC104249663 n=1 Tax=Nicotiana sylvestris TaxID=4096 RepID=A0A1U7Z0J9_NICSY|nr:PREDICTED: uncharacterized protein LOC104249663 [Nicotiana sylvestris]